MDSMRIDKLLWTARLYKTRSQAGEACKGWKIKIDGISVKPSREIKVEDIVEVQQQGILKKVKVLKINKSRVGAKLVSELMEDLTPPEEYEHLEMLRRLKTEKRDRGAGRPTKKERRDINKLKRI